MPQGNQPFSGGSGPTWNDAMMLGEHLRSRQGFGAIAFSTWTGSWGYSFNAGDHAEAERIALGHCQGGAGQIVAFGHSMHNNIYLALALPDNRDAGGAWRCGAASDTNARRAQLRALAACAGESSHIVLLLDTLRGSQDIVNGPLSLQRERRLRPRRKIRAVIFGVIALAFLGGAISDLVTAAYNSIGSFLFFALFGWASLDQMAKAYRKLPAAQVRQTGA